MFLFMVHAGHTWVSSGLLVTTGEKPVLIGFKVGDIYPEVFTFDKGDKKGQQGVSKAGC